MDKLKEIYEYVLQYVKLGYDYIYPYAVEAYNYSITNKKETVLLLVILWMALRIHRKRKRKLKKRQYKKTRLASKKRFYNTGIRFEANIKDIIKIKVKLADYCDKKGVRYCYLFNIKLFGLELLRVKYIDQKGAVYKRKVTFRS
jgi:hypothetical protein